MLAIIYINFVTLTEQIKSTIKEDMLANEEFCSCSTLISISASANINSVKAPFSGMLQ